MALTWSVTGATAVAQVSPYDLLEKAWTPYMSKEEPLAFPLKVNAMCSNVQHFWGGGKDLFLEWCKRNAADWLNDSGAVVTQQGDPNFGNIGTFLAEGEFGTIGFGLLDYDESCRLPVQIELLQGIISIRILAGQAKVRLSPSELNEITTVMLDCYRSAATSTKSAGKLLNTDREVKKLLKDAEKETYAEDLARYTDGQGHFRKTIVDKEGTLRDILQPAMSRADAIAEGLAAAMGREKRFRKPFAIRDAASIRTAIKDVAQRTHVEVAGSQGLRKYLVLMDKPLKEADHDILLYLKEQVPSAAERAGLVGSGAHSPAERCAADMELLSDPRPFIAGACKLGSESYLVTVKHPWTKEAQAEKINNIGELLEMVRIWATVTGASHRQRGEAAIINGRIDKAMGPELIRLSNLYMVQMGAELELLKADPRARRLSLVAREAVRAAAGQ